METQIKSRQLVVNLFPDICIQQFLNAKISENLSPFTIRHYRNHLKFFYFWLEKNRVKDIRELTPPIIREFLVFEKENRNLNDGGLKSRYTAIKAFINFVWDEFDLDIEYRNPIKKVKAPHVEEKFLYTATLQDIEKLILTCQKTFTGIRDKAILACLLDTGVRCNEFLQMNIADVDLFSGEIIVRHTKNKKIRKVYLAKQSRKLLRKYLALRTDENPALWVNDVSDRLCTRAIVQMLVRRCKQAGIKRISPHCFRRAFAKYAHESLSLIETQKIMGHCTLDQTRHYIQLDDTSIHIHHEVASPTNRLKIN